MKVLTPNEAAVLIKDNTTVSVSGVTYRMVPEEILAAVEDRFINTGSPQSLTLFFPTMVEKTRRGVGRAGTGLDHLAHQGLIRRLIGGSYSRLTDSRINQMIFTDMVEAYNIPMGTLYQLLRCAASGQVGLLTPVGIGTFVDPREQGGRINNRTKFDLADVMELKGQDFLFYPTIPVDVALIRGTTADTKGNISLEDEPFSLGVLYHAMAAKSNGGVVIVQVKQLAENGSIPAKAVKIPGFLIDIIVLDDPSQHDYLDENAPTFSGSLKQPIVIPSLNLNTRTVIAHRALMEMKPGMVVNLGAGIPMYDLANVAAAMGLVNDLNFTVEHGPLGGFPSPGGINRNPEAFFDSLEVFDFYEGGGIDVACLSFAEVDKEGNVNVSRFRNTMPGVGGFINITLASKKILYCGTLTTKGLEVEFRNGKIKIVNEGKIRRFVDCVEQKTFSGKHCRLDKQEVIYITERCVFKLEPDGLVLTEIAPGADVDRDICAQLNFEIRVSGELKLMNSEIFQGFTPTTIHNPNS